MSTSPVIRRRHFPAARSLVCLALTAAVAISAWKYSSRRPGGSASVDRPTRVYDPRLIIDTSGLATVIEMVVPWRPNASLAEIANAWERVGYRGIQSIDEALADPWVSDRHRLQYTKALLYHFEGEPKRAYETLQQLRSALVENDFVAQQMLYTIIFFQGVTGLRWGETENCVMCRGESSCILPISSAAVHTRPDGSRLAIEHFTEYLEQFPDDLGVQWLLNLAYMTLGEYPHAVDPRFLLSLDHFSNSEFNIGKFRDIGHLVGVNRLNQAGGGIMEDFDNDGLLDIAATTMDTTGPMLYFRNNGMGTFDDCTATAGLSRQLGGLNCMQTDFNNDGYMDIFIVRGAWMPYPMRPSLLQNNGDGTFTDVTADVGLLDPVNSIAASWADYDNDGLLDLFLCCERQPSRLYHNLGNGMFRQADQAGVDESDRPDCKGAAWIDYDNDGYQDLFLNHLTPTEGGRLFHNHHDGTFSEVSSAMGIDGPCLGFSCWAWDYDNDGWLDIFSTCYERSLGDMVKGVLGQPHNCHSNKLYRNLQGRGFTDVTADAGLDMVFVTMGSNFGDFDNDGFLDMYLGTGQPALEVLAPNRMFKNVAGRRFAEISGTSGTGHLQKGHGVACGDWDRDGNTDIFIEMGGATNGDKYHNILFQNPGQGNHWLTIKLVGLRTNRPAIGARIKVITAGKDPLTVYRHVTSGSSFGANPLQLTIGLANANRIAELEIHWPSSGATQVFHDIAVDQAIEVAEFAEEYRTFNWEPIPIPK